MDKLELLKKLVEENPQSATSLCLLASEYASLNKIPEALFAFSESLKYCDDELKGKIMASICKLTSGQIMQPISVTHAPDSNYQMELNTSINEIDYSEIEEEYQNAPFTIIEGGCETNKVIQFKNKTITFNDVGGLESLKNTISMKIIKPFTNPGLFDKFKKKIGGGIMLFGPPGCGKTFIAKATAGECKAEFIPVHITDILSKYIGESEQNVADIFSTARSKKPSVLFFDELDSIGFNRSRLSSEHMRSVIDQLLTEIEGINTSTDKLLIIGATNMPWDVDPAFKRPGRFDKLVFVSPPDQKAREIIFKLKLAEKPIEAIDFETLAEKTELYSGADIENVVETATEDIISEIMNTGIERQMTMRDLIKAIDITKPSTVEWLRTIKNYVKYANQSGLYDDVSDYLSKVKRYLG